MTKMKDSGVKWIGQIPEDWSIPKVKNLFNIGRGRVIAQTELDDNGKYPVYSSQTQNDGCLGYINSYDFDIEQLTWTTDGVNAGTVFLRAGKHNCTNVCGTLQLKKNDNLLKYLKYALEYIALYHKRADTNGFKIMNNEMAEIIIPLPSIEIQKKIAKLLDKKCGEIDELIAIQEKEIEKLKEYKTSVITKTVTNGLDDSVPMKDSGIDWIGQIPAHWKVCKIKTVALIINGDRGENYPSGNDILDEGIPFFNSENVGSLNLNTLKLKYISEKRYKILSGVKVCKNDIIYCLRGSVGKCSINNIFNRGTVASSMTVVRSKNIIPELLNYILKSKVISEQISIQQNGTCAANLSAEDLGNFNIPIMSDVEQKTIYLYIEDEILKIDNLLEKKQQKIEKLQEYKKSLIYEYVTGKKDVV